MEQKDKKNAKGIWLPIEIYLDNNLNWTERILLIEINSLDKDKGCFASNSYFAQLLNTSETTISISISKLKRLGYIILDSFDGRARTLKTVFKFPKSLPLSSLKSCPKENLKHSNIYNNIYINKSLVNKNLNNNLDINLNKSIREEIKNSTQEVKSPKVKKDLKFNIREYTKNKELINSLDEFIKHYHQTFNYRISYKSFELKLKKLDELTKEDENKIKIVNLAIEKGWKNFYLESKFVNNKQENFLQNTREEHEKKKKRMKY